MVSYVKLKLRGISMEKVLIEDIMKYKFLSGLKTTKNTKKAIFTVHTADVESNDYKSCLWQHDIENGNTMQLTSLGKEKEFIYLDDENILFSSLRDEKDVEKMKNGEQFSVFYKLNLNGGEALEAFRISRIVTSIKMINENEFAVVTIHDLKRPDFEAMGDEEKVKAIEKQKEEKDYEILEEIPYWSNGTGYTDKKRTQLMMFNSETKKLTPITEGSQLVEEFHLNDEKTKILFTASMFKDVAPLVNEAFVYDIENKKTEKISVNDTYRISDIHFLNDTEFFLFATDMKKYGLNENGKFYLLNTTDKKMNCLTPELDYSPGNSVGSDCRLGSSGKSYLKKVGDKFYFVATENHNSSLFSIDKAGAIEKIIATEGTVDEYDLVGDNFVFIGFRGNDLLELYSFDNGEEKKLTNFNQVNEGKYVGTPEPLSFEIDSGVSIDGWVIKPIDYDETKKYPAVFDIHGGPKTAYGIPFFHEMQTWASEGYFVFFSNPRGSSGKGNEFADIRGKYGTIDYDDLMKFTDLVLEKYPAIDEKKVGVTGGSYGGFMTNWIIGHTQRYAAAATQRSIANWISMGYTSDIGFYFVPDQCGATPWENIDLVWEQSPLKHLNKAKTPTLVIHSEEDYRCWYPEGLQVFTALKLHGVESRLCMFRGETHELSRSGKPKHRMRRLKEITDWFDKYLK